MSAEHKPLITINRVMSTAPSGSGIDNGTRIDLAKSNARELHFTFDFHFMNGAGYYDGWESYKLKVTPAFVGGLDMHITGKNRNDIKDYLYEMYDYWLKSEIEISTPEGR